MFLINSISSYVSFMAKLASKLEGSLSFSIKILGTLIAEAIAYDNTSYRLRNFISEYSRGG